MMTDPSRGFAVSFVMCSGQSLHVVVMCFVTSCCCNAVMQADVLSSENEL